MVFLLSAQGKLVTNMPARTGRAGFTSTGPFRVQINAFRSFGRGCRLLFYVSDTRRHVRNTHLMWTREFTGDACRFIAFPLIVIGLVVVC
jgi:hypothetical protein